MQKIKDNKDMINKIIALTIAIIGMLAIVFKIEPDKINPGSILSTIKDLSQALIGVFTLIIALKISRNLKYKDFKALFEDYLKDWVNQNRYLIDTELNKEGREHKEYYYMLTKKHHSNFVTRIKLASEFPDKGGQLNPKGAFLYIDYKNKEEIIFGINQSFFKEIVRVDLKFTLEETAKYFKTAIEEEFNQGSDLDINIKEKNTRIVVSLKKMKKTEANAKRLIDLVEFVKTMIIAMA